MQVKKQQLELDMAQQIDSKLGKEYIKACTLSHYLVNLYAEYIIRNVGWMKHKLESRLLGEISITSNMQMTPHHGRNLRTKEPRDESERGE